MRFQSLGPLSPAGPVRLPCHDLPMPDLPHLPSKVVRFHWEQVSHLDGTRRVPVVDVQVETDDGPAKVMLEVLPGSLEVRRYTATRSPLPFMAAGGGAGLIVATSKDGCPSGVWP